MLVAVIAGFAFDLFGFAGVQPDFDALPGIINPHLISPSTITTGDSASGCEWMQSLALM